jgi:formamidopyrimidine-DNA glycosylase
MPELPEVETIKRDLSRLIVGKEILEIWTDTPKMVQPSLKTVKKQIVGTKIKKLSRRAKLLQIFLSNHQILVIHLKLTGRLLYRDQKAKKDDWARVIISLNGDKELRFSDLRKFGWVKLVKNQKALEKILAEFGPEPLDDLTFKAFKKALASSRRPVKVVILDQKKMSGIGNIYACDALFLARIDPRKPANEVTEKEAKKLFEAVKKVLRAGIKYRGASDQYYLDALGHKGAYQDHFLVYNREGKKCFGCQGNVAKIKVAGRGTYYCPSCQK